MKELKELKARLLQWIAEIGSADSCYDKIEVVEETIVRDTLSDVIDMLDECFEEKENDGPERT